MMINLSMSVIGIDGVSRFVIKSTSYVKSLHTIIRLPINHWFEPPNHHKRIDQAFANFVNLIKRSQGKEKKVTHRTLFVSWQVSRKTIICHATIKFRDCATKDHKLT